MAATISWMMMMTSEIRLTGKPDAPTQTRQPRHAKPVKLKNKRLKKQTPKILDPRRLFFHVAQWTLLGGLKILALHFSAVALRDH